MSSENVLQRPVSLYMSTGELTTIAPEGSVADAIRLFNERRVAHIPVLAKGSQLVGVVCIADILRLHEAEAEHSAQTTCVADIMVQNVETLAPTAPMKRAAELLRAGDFHSLLIAGDDGELMGILTSSDLICALTTE